MARPNFLTMRQSIDSLIKDQKFDAAGLELNKVSVEDVPKSLKASFANLARRADLPLLSLKFLWSEVFASQSEEEAFISELASTLRKLGLSQQAGQWIDRLPESQRKFQELAFVQVHQWKYKEAKILFEKALEAKSPKGSNANSILKVNLAACQIFLQEPSEALKVLSSIEQDLRNTHHHLYLNVLELKGQAQMQLEQYAEAKETLQLGLTSLNSKGGLTSLFLTKWLVLLKVKLKEIAPESLELSEFQSLTRKAGHWETLRDLDYHLALWTGDGAKLSKVQFGTPFESFKDRVIKQRGVDTPAKYLWADPRSSHSKPELDSFLIFDKNLPYGQTNHRLLLLLLSDQYRPFPVTRIFDQMFPEELYNPFTSEKRIHNLISSLRKSFVKMGLPCELETSPSGYRLRPNSDISFWIREKMNFLSQTEMLKFSIQKLIPYDLFSRHQAEKYIPLSSDQWQRHLKQLIDSGDLEMSGHGKAAKYRIKLAA